MKCTRCGAPVVFVDAEGVFRHSGQPWEDASGFCARYGYPVDAMLEMDGEVRPFDLARNADGTVTISVSETNR